MKPSVFILCCVAAALAGAGLKRWSAPPAPAVVKAVAAPAPPMGMVHPLNARSSAPGSPEAVPLDGAWSIPKTLHPSLRNHRADLEALIAAQVRDKAAGDAAVSALYYLYMEDPEAAMLFARHPVINAIPGAAASVVRSLEQTDPARAVAFARETEHPELLYSTVQALAAKDPATAERELAAWGIVEPAPAEYVPPVDWSSILVANGGGGLRQATALEELSFRIKALKAVEKLAAGRAGGK